jgi:hypothetical protein
MSNITYDWPPQTLSNLMGAYDEGKWEVKVIDFATGTGTLKRGTVVCLDAGGKGTIAAAGNENQAYGILLDEAVDATLTSPVGSVARAGSFRGDQLLVSTGTDRAKLSAARNLSGTGSGRTECMVYVVLPILALMGSVMHRVCRCR